MSKNLFLQNSLEDFSSGIFENSVFEDGSIHLSASGGLFLQCGCYTSPPHPFPLFTDLLPSWNASTPPGTAVEFQARVQINNKWSQWFNFGKWSPFIVCESTSISQENFAHTKSEHLTIQDRKNPADMAQMRIFLYSDNNKTTPKVHLMSISVRSIRSAYEESVCAERKLNLPAYSCLVRDPSISSRIPSATTLAMLLNRWGEDALPEEVARCQYDNRSGRFGNIAFITAAAGAYGYECYLQHAGINTLKKEIKAGNAVGALIHYKAPELSDVSVTEDGKNEVVIESHPQFSASGGSAPLDVPEYSKAVNNSNGHLVAVCGFSTVDSVETIHFNDPLAKNDKEVAASMPLSDFSKYHCGICLFLRNRHQAKCNSKPVRISGTLSVKEQEVSIRLYKDNYIPDMLPQNSLSSLTFCYTLNNNQTYASAAQKHFYYLYPNAHGRLTLDTTTVKGKKLTLYCISGTGTTWTAEKTF